MTIFVRPARREDSEKFTEWASPLIPNFDPAVVSHPGSYTLCAFSEKGILGFLPIQAPIISSTQMLETLVMKPDATDLEIAGALREFVKSAITIGYMKDAGEIYFVGDHEVTNKIAARIFEQVPYPVYRLRLKELECKESTQS